jgi:hypothetical protein
MRASISVHSPRNRGVGLRQRAAFQDAFHNAAAEHGKSALRYGFADRRCNDCPDRFLRLRALAVGSPGVLQQSGDQGTFLRAEDTLVPH